MHRFRDFDVGFISQVSEDSGSLVLGRLGQPTSLAVLGGRIYWTQMISHNLFWTVVERPQEVSWMPLSSIVDSVSVVFR